MYARDPFTRAEMLSSDGDFSQGFGIVPDELKPALLWTYNHCVQPGTDKDYDVLEYPHLAAWALANWPIGAAEQNPGEVLPRVMVEKTPGYFIFRNGWKGNEEDIIVTVWLGCKPDNGRGMGKGGTILVLGGGMRYSFPGIFYASKLTYHQAGKDGSGVVSGVVGAAMNDRNGNAELKKSGLDKATTPTSVAVDLSRRSGSDLVVVQVGPQVGFVTGIWCEIFPAKVQDAKHPSGYATKTTLVKVGDQKGAVMTLQKGPPPEPKVEGQTITVGQQTFTWDGQKLAIGK